MKRQFSNELAEGARVDTQFVVRAKEMRAARSGDAYLAVEFADRAGHMPGVFFHPSPEASSVPVGAVVTCSGDASGVWSAAM